MRFRRWTGGTILAFSLLSSPAPLAFSSLEFFGGAYHSSITVAGLSKEGFSEQSLHWICQGNISMDKFYLEEFSDDRRHFTDMTFGQSEDFLEDQLEEIVENAGRAVSDYQVYRQTLIDLGEYLHTVQDFYAHTNWVEKVLVETDGGEVPLAPDDFDDFPYDLVSPYTLNHYLPPGEASRVEDYKKEFGHDFYSVKELASLSDRERIRLVANPERALNHLTLAKDNPSYAASLLRWDESGPTLFEIAEDLAIRETARQWRVVLEELQDKLGKSAASVARVLRQGWASDFPHPPAAPPALDITIEDGELRLSNDLTIDVRLILRPSRWDKDAAREAIELFTRLTRPRTERHRFRSEGLTRLSMVRDDHSQTFHLGFRANLYGSSRTLVKLKPLSEDARKGAWEAEVLVPEELSQISRLLFHSRGEISVVGTEVKELASSGDIAPFFRGGRTLKLRIAAPRGGWEPPSWLREYLRR